jgi:hypothetical protein
MYDLTGIGQRPAIPKSLGDYRGLKNQVEAMMKAYNYCFPEEVDKRKSVVTLTLIAILSLFSSGFPLPLPLPTLLSSPCTVSASVDGFIVDSWLIVESLQNTVCFCEGILIEIRVKLLIPRLSQPSMCVFKSV